MTQENTPQKTVAIIGGGPSGLIAAEKLASAGLAVTVYERMPTLGRKFLMAGRGGLNLTHSEGQSSFLARYREAEDWIALHLGDFTPGDMKAWSEGLGQKTFVGSSGRIFPEAMKASPLLRAWRARLDELGVEFRLRHQWTGWDADGHISFITGNGESVRDKADAVVLALGGASWPRLGSDAGWVSLLEDRGVDIKPFQVSNCGVNIDWSDVFKQRFAGTPLKNVALTLGDETVRGEAMITEYGLEGGAVYALSAALREALKAGKPADLMIDLRPTQKQDSIAARLSKVKKGQSLTNTLKKAVKLTPAAISLMRESGQDIPREPDALAGQLKAVALQVNSQCGMEKAISSAGGIALNAIDENMMLNAIPGVFVAGEMLDWEAPTSGYLLQASFATGMATAYGIEDWLGLTQEVVDGGLGTGLGVDALDDDSTGQ